MLLGVAPVAERLVVEAAPPPDELETGPREQGIDLRRGQLPVAQPHRGRPARGLTSCSRASALRYRAVSELDVQGATLFLTLAVCLCNLLVDVLYSVLDPRVRLS